jgi:hypothetical protein
MANPKLIISDMMEERRQGHATRVKLYEKLEKYTKIPIISYFTSFDYPVIIADNDAEMLEGLLQKTDLSKGFVLMINSPGGSGLAAERIIKICRSYSDNSEYIAMVPGKAKSAATMICLGSSKIIMGVGSELGPIDPQIIIHDEKGNPKEVFSAHNIVNSYYNIFKKAVKEEGHIEPYIQALSNYDPREIEEFRAQISLSEDIAVKSLKSGMLSNLSEANIKKKIHMFSTPVKTKVHARPIYSDEAMKCGLEIEKIGKNDDYWPVMYELYMRLSNFVSHNGVAKVLESKDISYNVRCIQCGSNVGGGNFGKRNTNNEGN